MWKKYSFHSIENRQKSVQKLETKSITKTKPKPSVVTKQVKTEPEKT